ncbi:hypothetical protein SK128_007365, partial [Halocaridina rubra]
MRSDEESEEKRALDTEVHGRRRGDLRWKVCITADMKEEGLDTNMTVDRGSRTRNQHLLDLAYSSSDWVLKAAIDPVLRRGHPFPERAST